MMSRMMHYYLTVTRLLKVLMCYKLVRVHLVRKPLLALLEGLECKQGRPLEASTADSSQQYNSDTEKREGTTSPPDLTPLTDRPCSIPYSTSVHVPYSY